MFLALISCKNEKQAEPASESKQEQKAVEKGGGQASVKDDGVSAANALQVAKSIEDFSTLVAAIETAGVEDAVVMQVH